MLLCATAVGCAGTLRPGVEAGNPRASADWIRDDVIIPMDSSRSHPLEWETQAQRAVQSLNKKVQGCYRKELKTNPRADGELVVGFSVTAAGAVDGAWIAFSTVPSLTIEGCVLPLFQALSLPPPGQDGIVIHYPYVFTSAATPPEVLGTLQRMYKLEDPLASEEDKKKREESDDYDAPW